MSKPLAGQLLERVLKEGSGYLKKRIDAAKELPHKPTPRRWFMLTARVLQRRRGEDPSVSLGRALATPVLGLVDLVLILLRSPLSLLSRVAAWLEWRLWSRPWICPYCFTPHRELFVCCPQCETIHSSLRPVPGEILIRHCQHGCNGHVRLLGNYRGQTTGSLVCREAPEFTGCRRLLPEGIPWGKYRETHIGVFGPTCWKKLAVLAMVWDCLERDSAAWSGKACGSLTEQELEYLRLAFREKPEGLAECIAGQGYTLARSAVFHVGRRHSERLVQFHNIAGRWTTSDDRLHKHDLHMISDDSLLFVLDLDHPDRATTGLLPNAELYSRIVRCIERRTAPEQLRKNHLRQRIAVVVPLLHRRGEQPTEDMGEYVRKADPHLWGLLHHTAGAHVAYFGGALGLREDMPAWVDGLIEFLLAPGTR